MSDLVRAAKPAGPEPGSRPIRVLHITDFHILAETGGTLLGVDTEQSLIEALDAVRRSAIRADLAILTGDLVQDPHPSSYDRLKHLLGGLDAVCYCLPGNHDRPGLMEKQLVGGNLRSQPQILLEGWQIVCLDSTVPGMAGGHLVDQQLRLLEIALEEQPGRHALVALHHHPVPTGSLWMDTMQLDNADRLFALLDRFPQVRALVFGHVHQAVDMARGGLRLFGTPSTCFQFQPDSADFALDPIPAGYRWMELNPDGTIRTTVERLARIPAGLDFRSVGY